MKNQQIPTALGVSVIIVFAVTAGIFVSKIEKNKLPETKLQMPSQIDKTDVSKKENGFEISDNWTLVSHYNFWSNPSVFTRSAYNFPSIEFSYPKNWEFRCCGDMDYASEHFIYSSKDRNKTLPYIRVIDYVLSGCPDSQEKCSIDKTVTITANDKFGQLTSNIPTADILPKERLNNLDTNAFVFRKSEKNTKSSKGYIINLRNDVIEIDFVNHELLKDTFIQDFLNRIFFESN